MQIMLLCFTIEKYSELCNIARGFNVKEAFAVRAWFQKGDSIYTRGGGVYSHIWPNGDVPL